MTMEAMVSFFLVSAVATAVPGPAVLYILSAGISSGLRGYGPGSLGILGADLLYFLLSVAGLGTFLLASYSTFVLIKWLGAAYLVWLGLRLIWLAVARGKPVAVDSLETPPPSRWLSGGFLVHAANPKALLYFGSIVPQFLRPESPIGPQIALLGLIHLLTALTVLFAYGFFAGRIRMLARRPWFSRTLYGTSGALLVAAGAGVASMQRR